MKLFFKEVFKYNYDCNLKIIRLLNETPDSVPDKSLRLINHIINAHKIWNNRILNLAHTIETWQINDFKVLPALNQGNYDLSLSIIDQTDFDSVIKYSNSKGDSFENQVKDILFHVINHSSYHRGQIASNLRENGIDPASTDYILYKR